MLELDAVAVPQQDASVATTGSGKGGLDLLKRRALSAAKRAPLRMLTPRNDTLVVETSAATAPQKPPQMTRPRAAKFVLSIDTGDSASSTPRAGAAAGLRDEV
jgi:hypothetical protein